MKLLLEGHDYRYAAEQILLSVFPLERPEYDGIGDGDSFARIRLNRGEKFVTATALVKHGGRAARGAARISASALTDKLSEDRNCQMIVKQAFYRAAMKIKEEKPAWGSLTGIRPGTMVTKRLEAGMSEAAAVKEMTDVYCVDKERAILCMDTAKASIAVKRELQPKDIAIYVGIPFCPTRCAYCSFVSQSVAKSMAMIPPFLEVLHTELEATGKIVKELGLRVIAVYIGGGTPTTLSAEQLAELFSRLHEYFDFSAVREFTVEAGRPDTITEEKLRAIEKGGVTRVSINPQSMSDKVLEAIGRRHTAQDVLSAYDMARRFTTADINTDLIAGLPADTPEQFDKTLDQMIAIDPENITVHTLSLKKGTRLTLEGTEIPGKEQVSAMLDSAQKKLRDAGYKPYYLYRQKFMSGGFENVGWAKEGKESLYNILIMEELCTILAAGGGASTKLVDAATGRIERIFDFKYPKEYIEGVEKMMKDREKIREFYGNIAK